MTVAPVSAKLRGYGVTLTGRGMSAGAGVEDPPAACDATPLGRASPSIRARQQFHTNRIMAHSVVGELAQNDVLRHITWRVLTPPAMAPADCRWAPAAAARAEYSSSDKRGRPMRGERALPRELHGAPGPRLWRLSVHRPPPLFRCGVPPP